MSYVVICYVILYVICHIICHNIFRHNIICVIVMKCHIHIYKYKRIHI